MTTECSICCEKFTNTLRKEIKCNQCNNHVCRKCVIIWLEERTNITCPCCNHIWSLKFAFDNIDKAFLNKYKEIQKNVLLKIEENFIPQTQEFVIDVKKKYTEISQEHKKLNSIIYKYNGMTLSEIRKDKYSRDFGLIEFYTKREIIRYLEDQRDEINDKMNNLYNAYKTGILKDDIIVQKEVKIICPCVQNNCRGFIRENNYKCGICEIQICNKCHLSLNENTDEHVCNKDDINTVKFIMKDSTPCPTCATRIHKIDGCDQMYCVQCKTAFSYKTGEVEKGRIHNPHYYEELRKIYGENIPREVENNNNNNQQEIPDFDPYFIISKIDDINLSIEFKKYYTFYIEKQEYYFHNIANINDYRIDENIIFNTNYEDRVDYLKNKITKENFQRKIYKKFKDAKYKNDIYNIINDYNTNLKNVLTNFYKIVKDMQDAPCNNEYLNFTMKNYVKIRNLMTSYSKLSTITILKLDEINNVYNYHGRKIDFYV